MGVHQSPVYSITNCVQNLCTKMVIDRGKSSKTPNEVKQESDIPLEDIFKLGASAAAAEFC